MSSTTLFAVCPHDTARGFEKWALLNTFVNKRVGLHSRFEPYLNFADFGSDLEQGRFLWAYLNPADFLKARSNFGFEGIARPVNRFDQAYVIAPAATEAASPDALQGKRLAAVMGYLYALVKASLAEAGIGCVVVPAKSYAEVMTLVERGDADFGVTYNEHFDPLAESAKSKFRIVKKVHPGLSHVIAVAGSVAPELKESARAFLLGASRDGDAKKVLDELHITGFEPVPEAPFALLKDVLESAM